MPIGELFDLEALAALAEKNQRWTFFLTASPLNIDGGASTLANTLAIMWISIASRGSTSRALNISQSYRLKMLLQTCLDDQWCFEILRNVDAHLDAATNPTEKLVKSITYTCRQIRKWKWKTRNPGNQNFLTQVSGTESEFHQSTACARQWLRCSKGWSYHARIRLGPRPALISLGTKCTSNYIYEDFSGSPLSPKQCYH